MTDAHERSGVGVEYDPDFDAYRGTFDTDDVNASTVIVEAIAGIDHRDPMDLEPLYDSIDTDALDSIVANADRAAVSVSFVAENYRVTVHGDGSYEIEPPEIGG